MRVPRRWADRPGQAARARLPAALLVLVCLGGAAAPVLAAQPLTILFFGDSLTAGYGVDPEEAYPALLAARIDPLGWPFAVVNAGLSGETSAGGLRRIDAVVLELAQESGAALIPFLLEGVGGVRELNQADGIHPTREGQRIIADNVWQVLARLLRARLGK